MRFATAFLGLASVYLQAQVKPVVSQREFGDEVAVIRLAPRFATAIRMPEIVSSVIVGDPAKFLAEHAEKEPTLLLVKPVVDDAAESNLLVVTASGKQLSFVLKSEGHAGKAIDFVVDYRRTESFLVEEIDTGANEVPGTESLQQTARPYAEIRPTALKVGEESEGPRDDDDLLQLLLERQRRAGMPTLYGSRPPSPEKRTDYVMAGVSEVIDQGREVLVLFSVVNPQDHAIELVPPQIQLAGKIKRNRWGNSEQFPIKDFRISRQRLGPGERADGVVLFERPSFKQSSETLLLQVAESGAIDRPALAPIGFGVSAIRKEVLGDEWER